MKDKKVREIYAVFDRNKDFLANSSTAVASGKLNSILENLYSPGPSFQYIFDFAGRKFDFVSDGSETLFGENPLTFEPEDFVNRIHPDDIGHYVHCQEIAAHFLFEHIAKEAIPEYKVSFQFRIKDVNGAYKLFLHQAIAVAVDDEHNISSSLANHSIIDHITTHNNHKISFINIAGGKNYLGIGHIDDFGKANPTKQLVSLRESEILKLISEGFSSKEIADYLHISFDTVRTHRKNILKKANFNNMPQAIAHCIKEGLI